METLGSGVSIRIRVLNCLSVLLVFFSITTQTGFAKDATNTPDSLDKTYQWANKNPFLSKWLERHQGDLIRHGMDLSVEKFFRDNKLIQNVVMPLLNPVLQQKTIQYRQFLAMSTAKARAGSTSGQFQDELNMGRSVLKTLLFPGSVQNQLHIYVAPSPETNGMTYSVPGSVDILLFEGLLDKLTPEQVKIVITHEAGHARSKHVQNQLVTIALFLATGESILDEENLKQFKAQLLAESRAMFAHRSFHYSSNNLTLWESAMADIYASSAEEIAEQLRALFPKEVILQLTAKLRQAMGGKANTSKDEEEEESAESAEPAESNEENLENNLFSRIQKMSSQAEDDEDFSDEATSEEETSSKDEEEVELDKEAIETFYMQLQAYRRSCEVTADRYTLMVASPEEAANVNIILAGGKKANPIAMKKQLEDFLKFIEKNPHLSKSYLANQKTHPTNLARALQYYLLAKTLRGKIIMSEQNFALYTYLSLGFLADNLKKAQDVAEDNLELLELVGLNNKVDYLHQFETKLKNSLLLTISNEAGDQLDSAKTRKLLSFLVDLVNDGLKISPRIAHPNGLLYDLNKKLAETITVTKKPEDIRQLQVGLQGLTTQLTGVTLKTPKVRLRKSIKKKDCDAALNPPEDSGEPSPGPSQEPKEDPTNPD